jgi:glycosyltransferase involved in cell wall biosynthesis
MNILFFSTYFSPYLSGLTTYPQALLPLLTQNNSVTVLTFRYDPRLPGKETTQGVTVVRMPYTFKVSKGFISLRSLTYYLRQLRKTDVVILNLPNFEGFSLAILARITNKKVIGLFHCRVIFNQGLIPRFIAYILNLSVNLQLKLSHHIIAYTKDYAKFALSKDHLKKTHYIYPPIQSIEPDEKYLHALKEMKKSRYWIGFAGRISSEKGLHILIESLTQLNKIEYELVIAGPYGKAVVGESDYYHHVMNLIKKHRIPHRFLGTLKGSCLASFYKSIDVLVLPSINTTEAFGMVQVEAMMQGTPVIASNLPGVRVPIRETGMGILSTPKNAGQLTRALQKILNHKSKFTSKQYIVRTHKLFNSNQTVNSYEKLFQEL